MTQGATIYLDVDGVINAVKGGRNPDPGAGGWDEWRTIDRVAGFPISFAPEMLRRIEAWAAIPDVEIAWLTTWEDEAPKTLCPAIGLDGSGWRVVSYSPPSGSRKYSEYSWWKMDALLADWDTQPFVWIDDDLSFEAKAIGWQADIALEVPSLAIAPEMRVALTRDDVQKVDDFLSATL